MPAAYPTTASASAERFPDPEKHQVAFDDSKDKSSNVSYEFDTPEDRRLLRKVDKRLLPVLTLLYLLSFLDRIDGLTKDIHVSPPAYNTSLALYFIAYVTFEIPANARLFRFDPQVWLPFLTLIWGIVSIFQGFVTDQASLFSVRYLLGAAESGLFPGVVFLFSVYYRRHERHWRVAVFFGGAALAGAFGGVLAYGIGKMDGIGGKRGWAWIFIIEGLLTVVISFFAFFWVPTWSYKAQFASLTPEERARLQARLAADSDAAGKETFSWVYVRQALADPSVWGYALLFHGFSFVLYSLSLFMPTIIADLGFATWKAQLMTVPPNALAALGIWFGAWAAARTKLRAPWIIAAGVIAIIAVPQYVGVHLASLGVYTGNALLLSWPSENISGQTKRAVAVAMQITIGDCGAITGLLIYRPEFAMHHFRKPHIIAIGYIVLGIASASALWYWMVHENKRRAEIISSGKDEVDSKARLDLGDRDVRWIYQV
ncbi:MFS general substrate transporter [Dentipellis sp. KUC8613]|nr:MFS general substrate transporter [Dentipellis sp. KUC8613]